MQAEGVLELFAELFVAFAGFTGLAGLLNRSESDRRVLGEELRLLVEFSLFYLVLSVVPLVFRYGGATPESAWRAACGVSAVASVSYYGLRFSSLREWSAAIGATRRLWFYAVVDFAFTVTLVVAATQLLPFPAAELYVFHLLYGLVGTAVSFLRLISPMWHAAPREVARRGGAGEDP